MESKQKGIMKDEIEDILCVTDLKLSEIEKLTEKLLNLFNVAGQLCHFCEKEVTSEPSKVCLKCREYLNN